MLHEAGAAMMAEAPMTQNASDAPHGLKEKGKGRTEVILRVIPVSVTKRH